MGQLHCHDLLVSAKARKSYSAIHSFQVCQREESMRRSLFGVSVAALVLTTSQPLVAQDNVDQQLGNVHFKTSCNEVAQRRFDRGMRYQHSFWYINARDVFEEAIKADPTCAMAYWGIALTLMDNPHAAIPRPNLAPGLAAITKAKEIGGKTERERGRNEKVPAPI